MKESAIHNCPELSSAENQKGINAVENQKGAITIALIKIIMTNRYIHSALLVLNRRSLKSINALQALNRTPLNSINALLALNCQMRSPVMYENSLGFGL